MRDEQQLLTSTLRAHPHGAAVARVMAAALAAVDPAAAVRRYLRREGDTLIAGEQRYDLRAFERAFIVGAGKAGAPMAAAAAEVLGDRLAGGAVVVKEGHNQKLKADGERMKDPGAQSDEHFSLQPSAFSLLEAGHPLPDERGIAGTQRILDLLAGLIERDLVLAVISGGGSALLTRPAPGVTLADMQQLTRSLLACGATINEINMLRKHLDQVKGGGLARLAGQATILTLILSDVMGDPLDVIASGPTVPDSCSFADAYAVLERYRIIGETPAAILAHLRRGLAGDEPETPKPGDLRFERVQNLVVGSNRQAIDAALEAGRREGFAARALDLILEGEAREIGRRLAELALDLAALPPAGRPVLGVAGGETTVTLRGNGHGGRNQETALAAVERLAGQNALLVTLATDGGDGPTDAAGAVVSGTTLARAQALGLDPAAHLARNDAYPFFDALGDLLKPGPTRTNVNDLALVVVG